MTEHLVERYCTFCQDTHAIAHFRGIGLHNKDRDIYLCGRHKRYFKNPTEYNLTIITYKPEGKE